MSISSGIQEQKGSVRDAGMIQLADVTRQTSVSDTETCGWTGEKAASSGLRKQMFPKNHFFKHHLCFSISPVCNMWEATTSQTLLGDSDSVDKLLKQYFGRTFYFLKQDHLQGEASPSLCEPAQKILYAFSTEADY